MERASFLPVTRADMDARGWEECDFIVVSGDAYVDHPSFAAALLGRLLEAEGYRVAIIAQPRWQGEEAREDLFRCGVPRLAWLVSAGAMDSMVSHYTANNKPRSEDAYSPGGKTGFRPDRALMAYTQRIREFDPEAPVVIGGIEASLRRFGHYDYWSNTVRHSILLDTKADILVYGMGERPLLEIASRLANLAESARGGEHGHRSGRTGAGSADGAAPIAGRIRRSELGDCLRGICGTMWRTGKAAELPDGAEELPCFQEIKSSKESFCRHFVLQEMNTDPFNARVLTERSEERYVVQELPSLPLDPEAFDRVMELPYARAWHPDYSDAGGIPGLAEVKFSLTSSRGCFGACSFCAITFHQGRQIQARSHESLLREAGLLAEMPDFKGYIHDVGGPTANFRVPSCDKQATGGSCRDRQCLGTEPCPALKADHSDYASLLAKLRALPGIKKVFVRSGIRFDYLMLDPDRTFMHDLCENHISGQLKVAPEHTSDRVLAVMRKSTHAVYRNFETEFAQMNRELGKKQYLVPYLIAGHPGSELSDAVDAALELKKNGFVPDQVQDFYPTPGTLSTCIYHTGLDPYTGKPVYVARGAHERALQRALLQFNKQENRARVIEALNAAGRADAIPTLLGPEPKRRRA